MIGRNQLQYGANEFASGMASSAYSVDGALAPSSVGINPFVVPGTIYQTAAQTDKSTNVADNIIASCEDITGNLNGRLAVGAGAKVYKISTAGAVTNIATGSDTYNNTRTDMAAFRAGGDYTFITSTTNISILDGDLSTFTESWWTTVPYYTGTTHPSALGDNPHPMIQFENLLWVADASHMHNITTSASRTASGICVNLDALALELSDVIYALGIDPQTGLMLISYQTNKAASDAVSARYFVGLFDGYSSKLRRKIPVDDLITSFHNVGGTAYCMAGQKLGMWNGNGVTFLRKLANVSNATTTLVYKHKITHYQNILLIADGYNLLAYGDVVSGRKGFFNIFNNSPGGTNTNIGAVFPLGNGVMGLAYATNKFVVVDITDSTTTGSSNRLALNNIYFPRPVFIRRVRVITTGVAGTGSTVAFVTLADEKGNASFAANASTLWTPPNGVTQYVFDVDYSSAKLQGVALSIVPEIINYGIVRIIIYYDVAE